MTTLTSTSTFAVAPSTTHSEEAVITVLPQAAPGAGSGRLVHPILGAYDYLSAPAEWTNLDADVVVPPVWSSATTLEGAANTLWPGHIRDVVVEERWTGEIGAKIEHVRMLVAFWTTPPNPDTGYIEWWPQYSTSLGYKVIILSVTAGGQGLTLDYLARHNGLVRGPVVLTMRIVGYAA